MSNYMRLKCATCDIETPSLGSHVEDDILCAIELYPLRLQLQNMEAEYKHRVSIEFRMYSLTDECELWEFLENHRHHKLEIWSEYGRKEKDVPRYRKLREDKQ